MKLGQKYSFKDKNGNEREVIWMQSVLDMERYFNHNVFCSYSGFSLVKEDELGAIWDRLDKVTHNKINKTQYINGRNPIEYFNNNIPQQVIDELDDEQNSFLPAQFQFVRLLDGRVISGEMGEY